METATKPKQAEKPVEDPLEYVMPETHVGEVVLIYNGRHSEPSSGVVQRVGKRTIDVTRFAYNRSEPLPTSGVRHISDPWQKENRDPWFWDYTETGKLLRKKR